MRNGLLAVSLLAVGALLFALVGGEPAPGAARGLLPGARLTGELLDDRGEPVVGGLIELVAVLRVGSHEDRKAFASVRADAQGAYRVDGVPAGDYVVYGEAEGHLPAETTVHIEPQRRRATASLTLPRGGNVAGRVRTPNGAPIAGAQVIAVLDALTGAVRDAVAFTDAEGGYSVGPLPAGVPVTIEVRCAGYESVELRDVAGRVAGLEIELRPAGRIEGVLVGRDGTPLAGSEVVVVRASADRAPHSVVQEVSTGADGGFVLPAVAAGAIRLQARGEDHRVVIGELFELAAGGVVDGVRLVAARGARLEIEVVDRNGVPVSGAEVVVQPPGDAGSAAADERPRARRTDGAGRAVFGALPETRVRLHAMLGDERSVVRSVDLTSPVGPQRLVLRATGSVALSAVFDDAEAPAEVLLLGPADAAPWRALRRVTADVGRDGPVELISGEYDFARARPGAVLAAADGGWRVAGAEVHRLSVAAGDTVSPPVGAWRGVTLSGVVRSDGVAVAGAAVRLQALPPRDTAGVQALRPLAPAPSAQTDAGGAFEFRGLAGGDYVAAVRIPGAPVCALRVVAVAAEATPAELSVVRVAAVEVAVRRSPAAPLAGAKVRLVPLVVAGDGELWGVPPGAGMPGVDAVGHADANGDVRFVGVPAGRYSVEVSQPDGPVGVRELVVAPDAETARAVVVLEARAGIEVSVIGDLGTSLAGCPVVVRALAGGDRDRVRITGPDGIAAVADLSPGEYRITAAHRDRFGRWRQGSAQLTAVAGATGAVTLVLSGR